MFQFKNLLLSIITILLQFTLATSQRIRSNLAEDFTCVSVQGAKTIFYLLEDERYAIVTDGILMENLYYEVEKGILTIYLAKEGFKVQNSLVLLYPKGNQVPKVINHLRNEMTR